VGNPNGKLRSSLLVPAEFISATLVEACRLFMSGEAALPRDFTPAHWPTDRLLAVLGPLNRTSEAHRKHLGDVVDALRARDVSWARIAAPLGVSRQTACERFG
jgi:DNA-binding transcriptional regulator PaaX